MCFILPGSIELPGDAPMAQQHAASAEAPAVFAECVAPAAVEVDALLELAAYVAVAIRYVAVLAELAAYAVVAAQAVAT